MSYRLHCSLWRHFYCPPLCRHLSCLISSLNDLDPALSSSANSAKDWFDSLCIFFLDLSSSDSKSTFGLSLLLDGGADLTMPLQATVIVTNTRLRKVILECFYRCLAGWRIRKTIKAFFNILNADLFFVDADFWLLEVLPFFLKRSLVGRLSTLNRQPFALACLSFLSFDISVQNFESVRIKLS